jgi:hypothetical protein
MSKLRSKLNLAALILSSSSLATGLAPTTAAAQNLPPCFLVWTDCIGTRSYDDGSQYVGQFKDDRRGGQGTLTWPDGENYAGWWWNDLPNGQGTKTLPNGEKYVGEWRDGKPNGQGTYTWPDGQKYIGELRDTKRNGHGTTTFPDGRKDTGEYKDDKRNGQFTITWPNGQKYVGEYKDDKQNGHGTYTWPSGAKYVGEFKDGLYDGQGTYIYPDGSAQSGLWKKDKLVTANSGVAGIPIEIEGGTFIIPVTINDKIALNFIIDSGASDVTVPVDVVSTLIRTGSIVKEDFLGEQQYQLADGSMVPSLIFVIRSLKVGDKVVENVRASVAPVKGSLLLGQSFLHRFNSWSVDNRQRLLFLN